MALATYIKDLLYRYDCVIVPDFGGFITNRISSQIDENSHTFYPPTKQLGFNHHLTHNDGLLANYIASEKNISFEKANAEILETVASWNVKLKSSSLILDAIGSIQLNEENQLTFQPDTSINYLAESFGLAQVQSDTVTRKEQKVIPLRPAKSEQKGIPAFIKYAASAAIILTLGFGGFTGYQNRLQDQEIAKQQKDLETKIQSATFVIDNPLPTIELNVTKELPKPYHVIAGAFQIEANAEKRVNQLKAKGFDAIILGKNKWGLTQVAYASYYKKTDAYKTLASVRKTDSEDAWLLVKKFQ